MKRVDLSDQSNPLLKIYFANTLKQGLVLALAALCLIVGILVLFFPSMLVSIYSSFLMVYTLLISSLLLGMTAMIGYQYYCWKRTLTSLCDNQKLLDVSANIKNSSFFDMLEQKLQAIHQLDVAVSSFQKLPANAQLLEIFFARMPCGISLNDVDGFHLQTNPAYQSLLGYDHNELCKLTIDDICVEQELQFDYIHIQPHDGLFVVDKEVYHRSGKILLVRVSVIPSRDDKNNPVFWYILEDKTQEKSYLDEIKKREEEARKISVVATSTSKMIMILDAKRCITWVNHAFEASFDFALDAIEGSLPEEVLFGEESNRDALFELIESLAQAQSCVSENIYYGKNGQQYQVLIEVSPVFDESQQITHYIEIVTDISERKAVERRLQISEQKFKDLVNLSSDWFWETDADHRLISQVCRPGVSSMALIQQTLGKRRWELDPSKKNLLWWQPHINLLNEHQLFRDFEYSCHVEGYEPLWISISGVPIFHDGKFMGYRGVGKDIQTRKFIEMSLKSLNERYRLVVNNVKDVIFQVNSENVLEFLNPAWIHLTGFSIEDSLGKNIGEFYQYDQGFLIQQDGQNFVIQHENDEHFERQYLRKKKGGFAIVEMHWVLVRDDAHKIIGATGTIHDVTQHHEIEHERQKLSKRLSLENALHKLLLSDDFDIYNKVLALLTKEFDIHNAAFISNDDLLGDSCLACIGNQYEEILKSWFDLTNQDIDAKFEKDLFSLEDQFLLMIDVVSEKSVIGNFYFSRAIHDFSREEETLMHFAAEIIAPILLAKMQSTRIEASRQIVQENLRESEVKANAVLNTAADAIIALDEASIVQSFNPAAEQMFGYGKNEIIGESLHVMLPKNSQKIYENAVQQIIREGVMITLGNETPIFAKNKVGKLFPIEMKLSRVLLASGSLITGIIRDVTERNRIQLELLKHHEHLQDMVNERTASLAAARDDAERANRAKSDFLANMSHELRTPMHAMLSFAKFGLKHTNTSDESKLNQYFNNIYKSGQRLMVLLNNLLDLSKLEAGKMEMVFAEVDFNQLLNELLDELNLLLTQKNLKVEVESSLAKPMMCIDASKMMQLMRNLLSNAIKFSHQDGIITVKLNTQDDEKQPSWCLEVIDQGIGIPESELERVFDKFVQSSATKTGAGGTGLGLPICKEIIAAHQGTIKALPAKIGAHFKVNFPAKLTLPE